VRVEKIRAGGGGGGGACGRQHCRAGWAVGGAGGRSPSCHRGPHTSCSYDDDLEKCECVLNLELNIHTSSDGKINTSGYGDGGSTSRVLFEEGARKRQKPRFCWPRQPRSLSGGAGSYIYVGLGSRIYVALGVRKPHSCWSRRPSLRFLAFLFHLGWENFISRCCGDIGRPYPHAWGEWSALPRGTGLLPCKGK
jgi:hypothetical protein